MKNLYDKFDRRSRIYVLFVAVVVTLILALTYTLDEMKKSIIESRKYEVYTVLSMAKYHSHEIIKQHLMGNLTREEAESQVVSFLSGLRDGEARYVWANDSDAIARVHVRKSVLGTFQKSYIKDMSALLKQDPIYKTATNVKPKINKRVMKINGITKLPEWDWTIGYGIYMDEIDGIFWYYANRIILAYAIAAALCILLVFKLSRKNTKS